MEKKVRNVKKKLRQIEELKEKLDNGTALDPSQVCAQLVLCSIILSAYCESYVLVLSCFCCNIPFKATKLTLTTTARKGRDSCFSAGMYARPVVVVI